MKFQKTERQFCRWKSTDNNGINIFLSLEIPCTFLLAKEKTWKRIFNINSELLQNCTEKQIMPSKLTINWLFYYKWCYLFIAYFDWKIRVFQQTVVRVYYILKICKSATYQYNCEHKNWPRGKLLRRDVDCFKNVWNALVSPEMNSAFGFD